MCSWHPATPLPSSAELSEPPLGNLGDVLPLLFVPAGVSTWLPGLPASPSSQPGCTLGPILTITTPLLKPLDRTLLFFTIQGSTDGGHGLTWPSDCFCE